MNRRTKALLIALCAATTAALLPRAAFAANPYPNDPYFTQYVYPDTSTDYPLYTPMGDLSPTGTTNHYQNFTGLGNCYLVSDDAAVNSGAWSTNTYIKTEACAASSSWPCCQHGTPITQQPDPWGKNNALNLNGGVAEIPAAIAQTDAWQYCTWFVLADAKGAIIYATNLNADGSIPNGSLVLASGTADNFVFYQWNGNGNPEPGTDESVQEPSQWAWACIGYDSASNTATLTGGNSNAQYTFRPSNTVNYNSNGVGLAAGDISLFGSLFCSNTATSCQAAGYHAPPNPTNGAGSGTTGNNCPQIGIISGEPKVQWCAPQLNCSAIDLSWTNLGQDFQWLGCIWAQVGANILSGIANAFIDLFVPSLQVVEADWNSFVDTLQDHVPTNYIYGALNAVPEAFSGAHTTPSLDLALPPPWSTTIHITWSEILNPFTPWRPLFAGLVYLGFGIVLTVEGRRAFEN